MGEAASQVNFVATQVASRPRQLQDDVLLSKHPQLREKLNFRAIYPYLNQHGLLPAFCDHLKLVDGRATEHERIDAILAFLTKCDKDEYLQDFIDCLKRSKDGTGEGHLELAESLEAAYNAAVNDRHDSDYHTRK